MDGWTPKTEFLRWTDIPLLQGKNLSNINRAVFLNGFLPALISHGLDLDHPS